MNNDDLNQWIQIHLGICPKNLDKYRMALTTRQSQVLEFFGDSVIGFIVTEYLVNSKKPHRNRPSWLTDIKAQIVNNNNLAQKAKEIALISVISILNLSSQEQITDSVVADLLEALIGVVYQEQGLDKCKKVVYKILNLEDINIDEYLQKKLDLEISNLEN